jgi:hypothetical protein
MYSVGVAYLLWFLSCFGILGFHRFYLGKIPTGILWMLTSGLGFVGSIYDFFTLPRQVHEANIRNVIYEGRLNYNESWRKVNDGSHTIIKNKNSVEHSILMLAKGNKGILTASDVALSANISIDEAKHDLDVLVKKGFAELRVRKTGSLVYVIPDLMDSDEPLEDM